MNFRTQEYEFDFITNMNLITEEGAQEYGIELRWGCTIVQHYVMKCMKRALPSPGTTPVPLLFIVEQQQGVPSLRLLLVHYTQSPLHVPFLVGSSLHENKPLMQLILVIRSLLLHVHVGSCPKTHTCMEGKLNKSVLKENSHFAVAWRSSQSTVTGYNSHHLDVCYMYLHKPQQ